MRLLTYIVLLFVILAGLTFACLNADPVSINYYVGTNKLPLALLLAIALGVGCILGLFMGFLIYLRVKKENLRLSSRLKLAEKEVANLRAIPLRDSH